MTWGVPLFDHYVDVPLQVAMTWGVPLFDHYVDVPLQARMSTRAERVAAGGI
jgi:hypothetical protein